MPDDAPIWAYGRQKLWNAAEACEKRKNSVVARTWVVSLPHELDADTRQELALKFGWELVERYKVAVDLAIHRPEGNVDRRHFHAHFVMSTRELASDGFGEKTIIWDHKETGSKELEFLRRFWEEAVNGELAKAGFDNRIDRRRVEEQSPGARPRMDIPNRLVGHEVRDAWRANCLHAAKAWDASDNRASFENALIDCGLFLSRGKYAWIVREAVTNKVVDSVAKITRLDVSEVEMRLGPCEDTRIADIQASLSAADTFEKAYEAAENTAADGPENIFANPEVMRAHTLFIRAVQKVASPLFTAQMTKMARWIERKAGSTVHSTKSILCEGVCFIERAFQLLKHAGLRLRAELLKHAEESVRSAMNRRVDKINEQRLECKRLLDLQAKADKIVSDLKAAINWISEFEPSVDNMPKFKGLRGDVVWSESRFRFHAEHLDAKRYVVAETYDGYFKKFKGKAAQFDRVRLAELSRMSRKELALNDEAQRLCYDGEYRDAAKLCLKARSLTSSMVDLSLGNERTQQLRKPDQWEKLWNDLLDFAIAHDGYVSARESLSKAQDPELKKQMRCELYGKAIEAFDRACSRCSTVLEFDCKLEGVDALKSEINEARDFVSKMETPSKTKMQEDAPAPYFNPPGFGM